MAGQAQYAKWKQGVSFPAKYESKKPCKKCGAKIQAGEMMRLGTSWGVYEHAGSCPIQGASGPPTISPEAEAIANIPKVVPSHDELVAWVKANTNVAIIAPDAKKIPFVAMVRDHFGVGLLEAKQAVDAAWPKHTESVAPTVAPVAPTAMHAQTAWVNVRKANILAQIQGLTAEYDALVAIEGSL